MALLSRIDALAGDGIEALVRAKHRRRLDRLGWSHALQPDSDNLWARGDPPPREGCSLEVLIDGAQAFGAMLDAIQSAKRSVWMAGWHVAPAFEIARGERPAILGEVLAEAAEQLDVRVLVWAGAPVPLFHPTRKEVAATIETLTRGTKIRCRPDPREHPIHCHHEKIIVIDGTVAFVGGIDLTNLAGDRYDTSEHSARRRLGWHDVGTRLLGPAVADVRDHFAMRWRELTGDDVDPNAPADRAEGRTAHESRGGNPAHGEPVDPAGDTTVQVVRTVSEDMYDEVPHGDFRILESYVRAISSARQYIYLENQFIWSTEIVELLAGKLRAPPTDDFRMVVVLPVRANNGQDDTLGQLGLLIEADRDDRLLAATIRSRTGSRDDRLYVHAKVGIVDDRWLTIGSANLNAHSLLNDTEMNVVTHDPELARQTRLRLWAEHLELDPQAIADDAPKALVDDRWRPIATEQLARLKAGAPPSHRLLALPGVSRRSRRLLGPLVGLVDDS